MEKKKQSDNPALSLFIADPAIARFLRNAEQHLLNYRDELTDILTPTLDVAGLNALRESMASLFPEQDVVGLFRPSKVLALRGPLTSEAAALALSVDDLVYFQLALILKRLASDYLSALDLFEAHREGFKRAYPRVLAFNPLTNAISWEAVRTQMKSLLEEGFRERYDEMAITVTDHFRETRLANEALMIGMMLIDSGSPGTDSPDGLAFESECESALRAANFTVERTPISGDFGVDLLARKSGLTYAVQCKCYNVPVGISAVQEAAAGRLHYSADCAIVVASSGFTTQARRLAESNSVLLIGPAQLAGLEDLSRNLL
jgi:hypothetical protein